MSSQCAPINISDIRNFRCWLKVGIFGPYRTRKKRMLIDGRDQIRKDSYYFTFLVENFPSIGFQDFREKSDHYLLLMDMVVFVFLFGCDNAGVSLELDDFVLKKRYLFQNSVILTEVNRKGQMPTTSLLAPRIAEGDIDVIGFRSRDEFLHVLRTAIHRHSYTRFRKATSNLSERASFLDSIANNPVYYDRLCDNHNNRAHFICIQRCHRSCHVYHLCHADAIIRSSIVCCNRQPNPLFMVCAPTEIV